MLPLIPKSKTQVAILAAIVGVLSAYPAFALETGLSQVAATGLAATDIRTIISNIIRVFLGFVGVAMLSLVLYGGYLYMTAQGSAEKIEKAKKVITNAAIGLVLSLSAYAIASFIISGLLSGTGSVTGPGGPGGGGGGGGGGGVGQIFGCTDPKPTEQGPYICKVFTKRLSSGLYESKGPVGTFVTIIGGQFGSYDAVNKTTKVLFTKGTTSVEAEVTSCNGNPSWKSSVIVVEVPAALAAAGLQTYDVVVEVGGVSSTDKPTGGLVKNNTFELTNGTLTPGISCVQPDQGPEGMVVDIYGKRFGDAQATSGITFDTVAATTVSLWSDAHVTTQVPSGATSGLVVVTVNQTASNGAPFIVTCQTNAECSSGCCYQSNYCAAADECRSGIGASCGTAQPNGTCAAGTACKTGLFCSSADECTCQPQPTSQFPVISGITPADGAPGNFITISGKGFGITAGQVVFMGGLSAQAVYDQGEAFNDANDNGIYDQGEQFIDRSGDDVQGVYPTNCDPSAIWKDDQIIVGIPAGAADGPIAVITSAHQGDSTAQDGNGTYTVDFTVNDVKRPGICALSKTAGGLGDSFDIVGIQFGTAKDTVELGGKSAGGKDSWGWTDSSVTGITVPNLAAGKLPVQVLVSGQRSNPVNFTVTASANAPSITYLSPDTGPAGQMVTIFGNNFGSVAGTVRFEVDGAPTAYQWKAADTNFTKQCADSYWKNTAIVVKVPAGLANTQLNVVVEKPVRDQSQGVLSNTSAFTACAAGVGCELRPGVCAISPSAGPIGTTDVTLYGEGFGGGAGQSKVRFWNNADVTSIGATYWKNTQIGSGLEPNHGYPLAVPANATTGPVTVVDDQGTVSNQIQFTVADCRTDATICGTGSTCCQKDGVCKTEEQCEGKQAQQCLLTWNFYTGDAPEAQTPPRVVEDVQCTDNTQSPTPWKNSKDACINALVSARFTQPMLATSLVAQNINIQPCGSGDVPAPCGASLPLGAVDLIDGTGGNGEKEGFIAYLAAQGNFLPNTWYTVTLTSGADGIRSRSGLELDGNADGTPGGNYSWTFKTRNSSAGCTIDHVVVTPPNARLETLSQTQGYSAHPTAANCNLLDANGYDWLWYDKRLDGTKENPVDPNRIITITNKPNPNATNNIDWRQTALPLHQGIVKVGAEPYLAGKSVGVKDEDNRLDVDLGIPEIHAFTPKDGLVRPEVNTFVAVSGRNFGTDAGKGRVYFGNTQAEIAACGAPWTDTHIFAKVPVATEAPQESYAGFALTPLIPLGQDSTVAAYSFDDSGNVSVQDQSGNGHDGEIVGVPKIEGQFGSALAFDGTPNALVRVPDRADLNPSSAVTVEAWVRPRAYTGYASSETILTKGSTAGENKGYFMGKGYSAAANTHQFTFSVETTSGTQTVTGTRSAALDAWSYVVGTYDANDNGGTVKLYVNGTLLAQAAHAGSIVPNQLPLLIGGADNSEPFVGDIDEVELHRVALTGDQIRSRYGFNTKESGMIASYTFEEVGGDGVTDSSGNGVNGTSAGTVLRVDGRFGKGVAFTKPGQSISVPAHPVLYVTDAFSTTFWFKPTSVSGDQRMVSRDMNGDFYFALNDAATSGANSIRFVVSIETGAATPARYFASLPISTVKAGEWNFVGGTFNGQEILLTVNGKSARYQLPSPSSIARRQPQAPLCLGGDPTVNGDTYSCTDHQYIGALDSVHLYNRVLSDTELGARYGTSDGQFIRVETPGGSDTSDFNNNNAADAGEVFSFSDRIYPFLCSLDPNFGVQNSAVALSGSNFGDSNTVQYQSKLYGVGSYGWFGFGYLSGQHLTSWANTALAGKNPISESSASQVDVRVSIEPGSEPYIDADKSGSYAPGELFANRNGNAGFDQGETLSSNVLPYYLSPVIKKISPERGPVKQWVTISGFNFGTTPGQVVFGGDHTGDVPPCTQYWSDTEIVIVVPSGAETGDLYVQTARALESNHVRFTVTTDEPGAGLCSIIPNRGVEGLQVTVQGDRFNDATDAQGAGILQFTTGKNAEINDWSDRTISAVVPVGVESGPVSVIKRIPTGRACVGFSIGAFCPSGNYDTTYKELPSNAVTFTRSDICSAGYILTDAAHEGGFPVVPTGTGATAAEVGNIATDGTHLFTKAYRGYTFAGAGDATAAIRSVYQLGTGFGGTQVAKVERVYTDADYNATPSFTYAKDGYFYTGYQRLATKELARYSFDTASGTMTTSYASVPAGLLNLDTGAVDSASNNLITANADYVFNVTQTYEGHPHEGFTVRVFDPGTGTQAWSVVKEFALKATDAYVADQTVSIIADARYIYIIKGVASNEVIALDWRNQRFGPKWRTSQFNSEDLYASSMEIAGQYDWKNRRIWTGQLNGTYNAQYVDPINKFPQNRIYRYASCASAGASCTTDAECITAVCGAGVSSCVRGLCTPAITNVTPLAGGVGDWVNVEGCHFGCSTGEIFFTGTSAQGVVGYEAKGMEPDKALCGTTWRCSADGASADQVITEIPNQKTGDLSDDAVSGPIKLITADGLSDTTEDATSGQFTGAVTVGPSTKSPQICALQPETGPRGTRVQLKGKNFGVRGDVSKDYVVMQSLISEEPYTDANGNHQYDSAGGNSESFIDLNSNGIHDTGITYPDQRVSVYPTASTSPVCPATGWSENAICIQVPNTAVTSNVSVVKENQQPGTPAQFTVTFGGQIGVGPQVAATIPARDETNVCRNGIAYAVFNQIVDSKTVVAQYENGSLVRGANVVLEACGTAPAPTTFLQQIIDRALATVTKVVGLPYAHADMLPNCTEVPSTVSAFEYSGRTYAQITPRDLLQTDYQYQIRVKGGATGVKSASGAPLEGANLDPSGDFASQFTTKNNLCSLNSVNVIVYTSDYSGGTNDPFAAVGEQRTNDLFTCTLANGCATTVDHDQDTATAGNQHIYRAVGYTDGGKSCFDPEGRALAQYTTQPQCEGTAGVHCFNHTTGDPMSAVTTQKACEDGLDRWVAGSWVPVPAMPIKTSFNWSRTGATDPVGVVQSMYSKRCAAADGSVIPVGSKASCDAAGGAWGEDDQNCSDPTKTTQSDCQAANATWTADPYVVQNQSGTVWVTARDIKTGQGQMAITAQAVGVPYTPIQKNFDVLILQCTNPWPSYDQQFPIAAITNAYNFGTYYCRDAGDPNTTTDDLPAAQYLVPTVSNLKVLQNTGFELGNLRNWVMLSGGAWNTQPTTGGICYKDQWRDNSACRVNPAAASGISGQWYIGTAEAYQKRSGQTLGAGGGEWQTGVLSSTQFFIEGDSVQFKIGGSATAWDEIKGQFIPSQIPLDKTVVTLEIDTRDPVKGYGDGIIDRVRDVATGTGGEELGPVIFTVADLKADAFQDKNGDGIWNSGEYCATTKNTTGPCKHATRAVLKIYDTSVTGHINFDNLTQLDATGREIPIRF